jgi:ADP-ribosylation factor GTPase-activating protein 2/3
MRQNLSKFEGSASISSAELFGAGPNQAAGSSQSSFTRSDLADIKEGVRQGVTKVAGRLSSLASGVMSSVQVRIQYCLFPANITIASNDFHL